MVAAVLIPVSFFLTIFAILYLFFSTRNRERLALIEKGVDANIFSRDKAPGYVPSWKIFLVNFSILLISVGLAIFVAASLVEVLGVYEGVAYPGTIITLAGIGLLVGFNFTKKLEEKA
ncbi:MAG: DUF6249 domain-containing protein [Bacteroidota bacterium]